MRGMSYNPMAPPNPFLIHKHGTGVLSWGSLPGLFNRMETHDPLNLLYDSAASFDGSAAMWLEAADDASMDHSGDYTVGGWFKVDNTTGTKVVAAKWRVDGTNQEFLVRVNGTDLELHVYGSTEQTLTHSGALTANKWYFFAFVVDSTGNVRTSYLGDEDGTALATETNNLNSETAQEGIAVLTIGRTDPTDADAQRIAGDVDRFWFYNAAMSSAEVTWMYFSGSGRNQDAVKSSSGLGDAPIWTTFIAYYPLNEREDRRRDVTDNNNTLWLGSTGDPAYVAGHVARRPVLEDRGGIFVRTDANNGDWMSATVSSFRNSIGTGSVMFWFKHTNGTNWGAIFSVTEAASTNNQFHIAVGGPSAKVALIVESSTYTNRLEYGSGIADGKWHHVHIQSNGSAYFCYIDGSLETPTVVSGANDGNWFGDMDSGTDTLRIGGRRLNSVNDFPHDGAIKDVAITTATYAASSITDIFYRKGAGQSLSYLASEVSTSEWTKLRHLWPISINSAPSGIGGDLRGQDEGTITLTNSGVQDTKGHPAGQNRGSQVSLIADLKNLNHAVQSDLAKRAEYKFFNQTIPTSIGILFDGVDDFYEITAFGEGDRTSPNVLCFAVLMENPTAGAAQYVQDDSGANSDFIVGANASDNRVANMGTEVAAGALTSNFEVWIIIQDGTNSKFYVDGGTPVSTNNPGTNSQTGATFGAVKGGASGHTKFWLLARAQFLRVPGSDILNFVGRSWHTLWRGDTTNWTDI